MPPPDGAAIMCGVVGPTACAAVERGISQIERHAVGREELALSRHRDALLRSTWRTGHAGPVAQLSPKPAGRLGNCQRALVIAWWIARARVRYRAFAARHYALGAVCIGTDKSCRNQARVAA